MARHEVMCHVKPAVGVCEGLIALLALRGVAVGDALEHGLGAAPSNRRNGE